MLRRRHRHGPYALAQTQSPVRMLAPLAGLAAGALLLFWAGSRILAFFDVGNTVRPASVALELEERGGVSVALDGGELTRAGDDLKLYPADRVVTNGIGHATLRFFDGTRIRMDGSTDATVTETEHGARSSRIEITLAEGTVWAATPPSTTFSGSILRRIVTSAMTVDVPGESEVLVGQRSVVVFSAEGIGASVHLPDTDEPVVVGEGQQFTLPIDADSGDLYAYREPLDPNAVRSDFLAESRSVYARTRTPGSALIGSVTPSADDLLTVEQPVADSMITTATVDVIGRAGASVDRVRVNGYQAAIDRSQNRYRLELALPDEESVTVTVEALDAQGEVLARIARTVRRDRTPPASPGITAPARTGEVYRTARTEFEIRGTAPAGTAGIIVNDYRLQLFSTGDSEWSYLASLRLGNLTQGRNVFTVIAINEAGDRSPPATLTILIEEGTEGVVSSAASAGSAASVSSTPVLNNDPLQPGTLKVTGPTAGTAHTATGSEFLIEGTVPSGTHTVWVNDYQLRLYEPGKTFFNYIASVELGTLKRGSNAYVIVARNDKGEVIDRMEYVATY